MVITFIVFMVLLIVSVFVSLGTMVYDFFYRDIGMKNLKKILCVTSTSIVVSGFVLITLVLISKVMTCTCSI